VVIERIEALIDLLVSNLKRGASRQVFKMDRSVTDSIPVCILEMSNKDVTFQSG